MVSTTLFSPNLGMLQVFIIFLGEFYGFLRETKKEIEIESHNSTFSVTVRAESPEVTPDYFIILGRAAADISLSSRCSVAS